ncbi:DUF4192 family protein [Microlunatus sp. Gsoil 973]|nr:DUF4192 domain-containing protein [Microlunatus sp. Gsoil 973]QGN31730.1 DUF4192 family protein [Microlunatus sp. Gsoil 973]
MTSPLLPSPVPFRRETRRLKADSPEDLLALMPYLLGFRPVESLVMMVIVDRVVKLTARVDLVDDAEAVADRFGAIAVANRAGGVVLIACSSDPDRADAMLLPVMTRLDGLASLRVVEALYTNGSRWWSRSCSDACCPAEGTAYRTDSNPLVAEAVFCGMSSLPDRAAVERLTDGPPESEHAMLGRLADGLITDLLRPALPERCRRLRELVNGYVAARERGSRWCSAIGTWSAWRYLPSTSGSGTRRGRSSIDRMPGSTWNSGARWSPGRPRSSPFPCCACSAWRPGSPDRARCWSAAWSAPSASIRGIR